jgi:4-hydroxy-tetrahydrodipicolinate synthase
MDLIGLRSLVNYLIDGGVDGIFVMGTTGEFQFFSAEEQWSAIETVVDEVGNRALVVAGATGLSIEETARNVVTLDSMSKRPDALVVAPLCYHSNRKLPQHMERLCKITHLPLILYNNIGIVDRRWKRKDIIPDIVARIASLEKIQGIKDSSGNLNYIQQIISCQSSAFRVFQGEESLIFPALQLGAVGAVPSIGNILPEICSDLLHAFLEQDIDTAKTYQEFINETHDIYIKYGSVPRVLKEYLARKGIIDSGHAHISFSGDIDFVLNSVEEKIDS